MKKREKNLRKAINDNNNEIIHQKMQLWTNPYENEYALRLAVAAIDDRDKAEETFFARTDPKARYTHIVAESDYLEDFKEGWEYTLRHFVEQYRQALQQDPKEEYLKNNSITSSEKLIVERAKTKQGRIRGRIYPIKLISYLKCHYCNLDFHDVKERKKHEIEWHV
jgi:hypothetical protein